MARTKKHEIIDNEIQDIEVTGEEEEAVVEITEAEATEVAEVAEKEEVKPAVKEKPAKKEISKIEIEEEVPTYNPWWRF